MIALDLNPLAAFLLSFRVADWQAQVDDYNRAYDDEAASALGLVAARSPSTVFFVTAAAMTWAKSWAAKLLCQAQSATSAKPHILPFALTASAMPATSSACLCRS